MKGEQSGSVAVEFALVAPVFIFAVLGIVELGAMLLLRALMELAVADGAHLQTMEDSAWATREEYMREQIQAIAGGLVDPDRLAFTTQDFAGDNSQISAYRITYRWHALTPLFHAVADANGDIAISTSALAGVANE